MKKLLLILLCLPFIGFGQNVNIPDANFKAYLVGNTAINTNGDAEIQVSEATGFNGGINCPLSTISSLVGIESFTSLTFLSCEENQLTNLDLSQNTFLTYLSCSNNQLTSIDISNCTNLTDLRCRVNQLTSLDVSAHTALTDLRCSNNQLTNLDVSNNIDLSNLRCSSNLLISLDVRNGNNTSMSSIHTYDNPNLTCINVDDSTWSTTNWDEPTNIDSQHYFSNNCPPSSIQEEHTTIKELLKVTDLLGRETKQTNQPLFYIYDDGTVEKRIVIE